ncbi:OmpA family protein [Brevundimonas sp.]|uniref:OmpA family protein n=1 Tax=Brevundimonas sp. TaxID=1871086 RepID=UPI00356ACDDD
MIRSTMILLAASAVALSGCGMDRAIYRTDLIAEPETCVANTFEVYFAEGEARLTEAARQAIGMTAARLQGCAIERVVVTGLSDASGGAVANQDLSERRAIAVAEAFTSAGWPAPAFEISAAGAQGATTAQGTSEPMRRRTEVFVQAAPRP